MKENTAVFTASTPSLSLLSAWSPLSSYCRRQKDYCRRCCRRGRRCRRIVGVVAAVVVLSSYLQKKVLGTRTRAFEHLITWDLPTVMNMGASGERVQVERERGDHGTAV